MNRRSFILALGRAGVDAIQVSPEVLKAEVENAVLRRSSSNAWPIILLNHVGPLDQLSHNPTPYLRFSPVRYYTVVRPGGNTDRENFKPIPNCSRRLESILRMPHARRSRARRTAGCMSGKADLRPNGSARARRTSSRPLLERPRV